MTVIEHLEELRRVLIISLIAWGVATVIGFIISGFVLEIVLGSAERAVIGSPVTIDIDHHTGPDPFGQVQLVDATAAANASNGVIHAPIEVANDLPKKGPSGWDSHAWMSRADQSLTSATPKTCSATFDVDTREATGPPQTNPTSASTSSRVLGPKVGAGSAGALRCPHGRTTVVPDTTTVPARPW